MERILLSELKAWKSSRGRKPLILQGARQVGKTWLLKEFGRQCFDAVCYVNCERQQAVRHIFDEDLDPKKIINKLSIFTGVNIVAESTLIIFDEVQEVPRALTSLKYFCEEAPQYVICCAGSLLGVALHEATSFPVGKVDFMMLQPMSFHEFLVASGQKRMADYVAAGNWDLKPFHELLVGLLKTYMVVGGMPSVVSAWLETNDYSAVEEEQNRILDSYYNDFSKHAPLQISAKIRHIWNSLPSQLAKENKKFVYGLVREGARAREYESALLWLADSGAVRICRNVKKPDVPLKAYADSSAFKVYMLDVGLLKAKAELKASVITDGVSVFTEFKGALTEQFVLQELSQFKKIKGEYYWTGTTSEIDFLLTDGRCVMPLEVKSGTNKQAKSMGVYIRKYNPPLALRASLMEPGFSNGLIDFPLYALASLPILIERYMND